MSTNNDCIAMYTNLEAAIALADDDVTELRRILDEIERCEAGAEDFFGAADADRALDELESLRRLATNRLARLED